MEVENNFEKYLNRRLLGENVVPVATLYGICALSTNKAMDSFSVLELNKKDCSYFKYNVREGRFHVTDCNKEAVQHKIEEALINNSIPSDDVLKWWKCIFYELDGVCTYDPYYDRYKIAENSDIEFGEIIEKLSQCISELHIVGEGQLFLTGELATNPMLRYVVQKEVGKALVLPENQQTASFDEKNVVVLPQKLSQLSLHTVTPVNLVELVDTSVNITLPLNSIDGEMLSGPFKAAWADALKNNQEDYSVDNMKFKKLSLQVECDVFQNIFLLCKDLSGNQKIIHIN